MRWLHVLRLRLRALFRRDHLDAEFESELRHYVAHRAAHHEAGGMAPSDAQREAEREAGSGLRLREEVREARGVAAIEGLLQDVRHGVRGLVRHAGFTAMSVTLVALSIGLACTSFAVTDAVLLRSLPGTVEPERLVRVAGLRDNNDQRGAPLAIYEWFSAQRDQVTHVFAFRNYGALPTKVGPLTVPLRGIGLIGEYFEGMGDVPMVLGHAFVPDQDVPVAVISAQFWQRSFGGAADVIGQHFELGDVSFEVVGVTRADFMGTFPDLPFDFLTPFTVLSRARGLTPAAARRQEVYTCARLKPGVSPEQYQARLAAAWPGLLQTTVPPNTTLDAWTRQLGGRLRVSSLRSGISFTLVTNPGLPRALILTMGLAGLTFLTSCVTLGLIVIARSMRNQRHTAIRVALGASRWRVMRPDLVEGACVALVGAACGLAITWWGTAQAVEFVPGDWQIRIDRRVVGVAVTMAAATAVLGGLVGRYLTGRGAVREVLQRAGQTGQTHVRVRAIFLAVQLALAVILVHSTALYVRDLRGLTTVPLGLDVANLHVYSLSGRLPQRTLNREYFQELETQVRALPGASAVALGAGSAPLGFLRDLREPIDTDDGRELDASVVCVFPGLFDAWGARRVAGRDIAWSDGPAAIVTERLARRLSPEASAVGRRVTTKTPTRHDYDVVGVVGDMAFNGPRLGQRDIVFVPCLERTNPWPSNSVVTIFVRAPQRSLAEMAGDIGPIVDRLGAHFVLDTVDQEELLGYSIDQERMLATVSGAFGVLIVLLTTVGLYAFCSYMLTFRSREMAIRAGLGASPTAIATTLLRELGVVTLAGLAAGLLGVFGLRGILAGLDVDIAAATVSDVAQVTFVLAVVVAAASAVPTARAVRIDVARTLRN